MCFFLSLKFFIFHELIKNNMLGDNFFDRASGTEFANNKSGIDMQKTSEFYRSCKKSKQSCEKVKFDFLTKNILFSILITTNY